MLSHMQTRIRQNRGYPGRYRIGRFAALSLSGCVARVWGCACLVGDRFDGAKWVNAETGEVIC